MDVPVGYATAHGSTREIAEYVAVRMARTGLKAEARSMADVDDPGVYGAYVLGSAVHGQAWLEQAKEFLRLNGDLLQTRPVWVFSVGMPAALRGPWRKSAARKERDVVGADLPGDVPYRSHRLLSGVIRPGHLPLTGRLIFRLMGCRYGDFREWLLSFRA
ncbi:flavodoxin domain-containing protein [Streptomyces formicae]|uniref:Flavodoxin n=1 Tax=Streptomyces formicae TaxID=1616117 RepID=A0A291QKW6_9ACTN|nr:flavodoxin domain-containing protein [Streptomyces formicae]ATL32208.1 flavodoxin [Streptomyces formicae]